MRRILTCSLLACALIPSIAFAHGDEASWAVRTNVYTIDVGYEPQALTVGQPVKFDFLLWKGTEEDQHAADFAQVWVRIAEADKTTVLATGIWKQPYGPTTLLFDFPRVGRYTLDVSYRNAEGKDIAVASLPVEIEGTVSFDARAVAAWALMLFIGVGIGLLGMRFRYSRSNE